MKMRYGIIDRKTGKGAEHLTFITARIPQKDMKKLARKIECELGMPKGFLNGENDVQVVKGY